MPSLMSALTGKFIKSRSAPRPSVLLAVVKETVLSVSWFIGFLLLRSEGSRTPGDHPGPASAPSSAGPPRSAEPEQAGLSLRGGPAAPGLPHTSSASSVGHS